MWGKSWRDVGRMKTEGGRRLEPGNCKDRPSPHLYSLGKRATRHRQQESEATRRAPRCRGPAFDLPMTHRTYVGRGGKFPQPCDDNRLCLWNDRTTGDDRCPIVPHHVASYPVVSHPRRPASSETSPMGGRWAQATAAPVTGRAVLPFVHAAGAGGNPAAGKPGGSYRRAPISPLGAGPQPPAQMSVKV